MVLRIAPDGPAASGGVELGDVVVEADGTPVGQSLDLLTRVRSKQPGESLVLGLANEGASREVRLEVGQTPVEIPQKQVGTLYNKAIVDLKHRMVVDPSNEPLARLNLALCHMALGDYETALKEHLPNVNFGDRTRGISQGTAYYYQGIAYMKLEELSEAARMFNQAMMYEEATLESDDGPLVAPLARRRLREIGQ
jgi:tetratricopeptide (TPR) repeat protein